MTTETPTLHQTGGFRWKSGLLAPETELLIDAAGATIKRGRKIQRIEFGTISRAYYLAAKNLGFHAYALSVINEGKETRLACSGYGRQGEAFREFSRAMAAMLSGWATVRPHAMVSKDMSPRGKLQSILIVVATCIYVFVQMVIETPSFGAVEASSMLIVALMLIAILLFQFRRNKRDAPAIELAAQLSKKAAWQ